MRDQVVALEQGFLYSPNQTLSPPPLYKFVYEGGEPLLKPKWAATVEPTWGMSGNERR